MKISKTQKDKFTISDTWWNIIEHKKKQENVIYNDKNFLKIDQYKMTRHDTDFIIGI